MQFEKTLYEMNGSFYIPLPADLAKYLEWDEKTTLVIQDECKSKGRFIAVFKK